ncbi:hypothetical protein AMATHDRAFT_71624 [Amanita thiersii Skay4041]|uniref:F-box domain-containing protein n=1 Tax=Amanita thiersii Skay4041 TaxID=703135 RepID=A0A2A9NCM6_9AGAR|nr:hypothetical protein AMATHDRAFT_71624 [Amanita thiersii Skay4041]
MAGFLRKKNKNPPTSPISPPIPSKDHSNRDAAPPPLFTRFATTVNSTKQPSRHPTTGAISSRVVSSPMALGSTTTAPHRNVTLNRTAPQRQQQQHTRESQPPHETLNKTGGGSLPFNQRTTTSSEYTNAGAYTHQPAAVQDAQLSRLPSAAGLTLPRQQHQQQQQQLHQQHADNISRRVPAYDKPLPVPVPTDDDPPPDRSSAIPQNVPATPARRTTALATQSHKPPPPSAFESRAHNVQRGKSASVSGHYQSQQPSTTSLNAMGSWTSSMLQQTTTPPGPGFMRQSIHDIQSTPPQPQLYANHNSTSYNHMRREPPPPAPFEPSRTVLAAPPHTAVHGVPSQSRQSNERLPHRPAPANGFTPALRNGTSALESKPGTHGDRVHHIDHRALLNGASAGSETKTLDSTPNNHGTEFAYDRKQAQSLPDLPNQDEKDEHEETGQDDDIFHDANSSFGMSPMLKGSDAPAPEHALYRGTTPGLQESKTLQQRRQPTPAREDDLHLGTFLPDPIIQNGFSSPNTISNMGAHISFPESSSASPAPTFVRHASPQKHGLPAPVDGLKARNSQLQGSFQQHHPAPHQDVNPLPQFVAPGPAPVRGKPLIFAAMEAKVEQQQPGEEQRVSVRLWDGQQDHTFGQGVSRYMSPPPPAQLPPPVPSPVSPREQSQTRPRNTIDNVRSTINDYTSPLASGEAVPPSRHGNFDGRHEQLRSPSPSSSLRNTTASTTSHRARKLSKPRTQMDLQQQQSQQQRNASTPTPTTPVKHSPLVPVSPGSPSIKKINTTGINDSIQVCVSPTSQEPQIQLPRNGQRGSGIMLLDVDEDPFAKTEGVRMLTTSLGAKDKEKEVDVERMTNRSRAGVDALGNDGTSPMSLSIPYKEGVPTPSPDVDGNGMPLPAGIRAELGAGTVKQVGKRKSRMEAVEAGRKSVFESRPASPASVEGRGRKEHHHEQHKRHSDANSIMFPTYSKGKAKELMFGLVEFVSEPRLLGELLPYLSFYEWCVLAGVSRSIRGVVSEREPLKELVLERFLKTIGYTRWMWEGSDPLPLSLQDLNDYMLGVSTPSHEYARVAALYVRSLGLHPSERDPKLNDTVMRYTAATRSYSRVVLRLRAQAEREAVVHFQSISSAVPPVNVKGNSVSRMSSRAPSPAQSVFSHGNSQNGHMASPSMQSNGAVPAGGSNGLVNAATSGVFKSPLFRLKRAPLLRVFVPSPDGDWLSDKSVLECEAECRRAGIMGLMRVGDVVWDVAVGDEGNVGKLVWDGSYLIDLDYSYSPVGDLPKYLPALAFPPSYFHRVIRSGTTSGNPIVHIDLSPWGEEIAANLQLLQDRVRTETPQGTYHNVVRWVHRSSFVIRPPVHMASSVRARGVGQPPVARSRPSSPGKLPIPNTHGLFVDPGWYGTIVVETEGTNESLGDLQDRCGPGVFPPRAQGVVGKMGINPAADARKVFRVMREKSRPGEIWIKTVSIKEKLL